MGCVVLSTAPPKYGHYNCKAPSEISIKGLSTGGTKKAYLMYPEAASPTQHFPFLVFGHGDTAGGTETYTGYEPLWKSVCSYGYIIAGPMTCPDTYCQNWYKDLVTTAKTCKEDNSKLNKVLGYTNFTKIGVYGHSMGGAATVHVSDERDLGIVASVGLHPSCWADIDTAESKDVTVPMLWFTGSKDSLVPPSGVWTNFDKDPVKPKVCAEIEGADHFEPTGLGPNREDGYVGAWFDCWIKGNATQCDYFFGDDKTKNICHGGPEMTKCQVDGSK